MNCKYKLILWILRLVERYLLATVRNVRNRIIGLEEDFFIPELDS